MVDIEGFGKIPYFAQPVGMEKKGINTDLGKKEKKKKKQGKIKTYTRDGWYRNDGTFPQPTRRVKIHNLNYEFKN